MAKSQRKSADAGPSKTVKVSVPLGVRDHARLCGVAALRGMTVSAFAAQAIRDALKGVTLIDRHGAGESADRDDSSVRVIDRPAAPANSDDPGDFEPAEAA